MCVNIRLLSNQLLWSHLLLVWSPFCLLPLLCPSQGGCGFVKGEKCEGEHVLMEERWEGVHRWVERREKAEAVMKTVMLAFVRV